MSGNEKDQKGKSRGRGLLGSFFFLERIFEAPSWQVDVLGRNSGLAIRVACLKCEKQRELGS